jgi:hypothetical protein
MSRDLTTEVAEILGWRVLPIVFLAEFEFDSGTVRLWSGNGSLTYNGNEYTGLGGLTSISAYKETQSLVAQGISFQLTGIPEEYTALALNENPRRRRCRLIIAFRKQDIPLMLDDSTPLLLDASTHMLLEHGNLFELVDSPVVWFEGLMNTMPMRDDGGTSTIIINADNEMVQLQQRKTGRYTDEYQRARYPGDTFFSLLAQNQDKVFTWGSSPQ